MTIKTRDFGEVEIEESSIITFENGVYAFEEMRKFVMLSPLGEKAFPMWLQCLDDPELCFIVFNPSQIVENYEVEVSDDDLKSIGLSKEEENETSLMCIAVVPTDYMRTTVNLKSPIILNADKHLAAQIIAAENYDIRHPLFTEEERQEKEKEELEADTTEAVTE